MSRSGSTTSLSDPAIASSCRTTSTGECQRRPPGVGGSCRSRACWVPMGWRSTREGTILFADGLSVGVVVDGLRAPHPTAHRPADARGRVAPFAGALAVLGASGEVLRYDPSGGHRPC